MSRGPRSLLIWLVGSGLLYAGSSQEAAQYVGKFVCMQCHKERGDQHSGSRHGGTWKPTSSLDEIDGLPQSIQEGPLTYTVEKVDGQWMFSVRFAPDRVETYPIQSVIGGDRFGLSFIIRVDRVESLKLGRSTLVEGRYMLEAGTERLKLSPGFPREVPWNVEIALGRTLSPQFEVRCLGCHSGPVDFQKAKNGEPQPPFQDTGVGCERCHGPGSAHLEAVANGEADLKITHPGKLPPQELLKICAQCHTGFFPLVRPRPQDVLVASQVIAIQNSQCFIQSGGFSCLSCHDPHQNARPGEGRYTQTCLGCHNRSTENAVICPVDSERRCISCHMPENEQPGNFHLTDHWIRVVRQSNGESN